MTSRRATRRGGGSGRARSLPAGWLVAGATAVVLVALIVASVGSGGAATVYGDPVITGASLPTHSPRAMDLAVGMAAPQVSGEDFDGESVTIATDGRPRAVLFLAHWCDHCRAEVPAVQALLDQGALPGAVVVTAVATAIDPGHPNYPPASWLESEGWTPEVLVDDRDGSVAMAFGLDAFPFWVFIDTEGDVVRRVSGRTAPEDLGAWFAEAAGS